VLIGKKFKSKNSTGAYRRNWPDVPLKVLKKKKYLWTSDYTSFECNRSSGGSAHTMPPETIMTKII